MRTRTLSKVLSLFSLFVLLALAVFVFQRDARQENQPLIPRMSSNAAINAAAFSGQETAPITGDVIEGPIVGYSVLNDVSPALRDIIPVPPQPYTEDDIREMGEPGGMEQISEIVPQVQIEDPVLQSEFVPGGDSAFAMPSPLLTFDGINNIAGVYPPDTVMDVGPNHIVQMVNLHLQVFNKSGVSLYGPVTANTIWSGFGGSCQTRNDGDPIVLYDPIADRWLVSQFTASNPYGECVAISTTSDPTGSYYRYFFQFSTSVFYDYPKLGVWPDAYYLSANRFTSTFQGASAIALNRSQMLAGQTASFVQFNTSTSYGSLLPADLDGAQPPAGSPNFFAEIGTTALRLWKFHVDFTTPANSTFTGPTSLTVASYNRLCSTTRSCIPQSGTTIKLDGLGDRLMHRLVYRNMGTYETLLVSHSVNAATSGTKAGVRWYEVRNPNGTASIYQQGTYSPDTSYRWMPSIAMDQSGNIAVGYSVSSSTMYPAIRYTGRLSTDALGQFPQGEVTLYAGTGSQTGTGSRWGDYSMMAVDPADDCTFWYTTEYLATTGTAPWRTRIGSFKFPSCGGVVPTPTATAVPPTATPVPPTATPAPPTNTPIPPTATPIPPTNTPAPPTNTPLPPTATPIPPTATNTPIPPTATATAACPNLSGGYCRTDNETRTWIAGTTNQSITADDTPKTVTLPFSFTLAGTSYTSVKISPNGNIHFGTSSSAYTNVAIPNTGNPNALIAAFWDDLNPGAGGAIYTAVSGTAPNRVFVIEWRDVRRYTGGTTGITFEIQLVESTNHIWILYQDTVFGSTSYDNGLSATSGVENAAGNAGNQYSYNTAVLTNNKVLHFWPQ